MLYLWASTSVDDSIVESQEYDHCVYKKVKYYQCILGISFQLFSCKWMKIRFLYADFQRITYCLLPS